MRIPLDIQAGVQGDDTTFAAHARWADASNIRFRLGKVETVGGWESLTTTLLTGVCRSVFAFTDNANSLTIGFGTHSALQLWQGGMLYDITPLGPPVRLGADALTVSNGSAVVTVAHTAHGYTTGLQIKVTGAEAVGRITPNGGPFTITVVDADHYTFTFTSNAAVAVTLGSNPVSTTSGSDYVTLHEPGYNIAPGTLVTISGATAVGGITPNGTFELQAITDDADNYQIIFTSPATGTASGGGASVVSTVPSVGGGAYACVIPQTALPAGNIDGTGSVGYSTGAWGVGLYGLPSTAEYFPRTWSFGAWGENLLASPRGGGIYEWSGNTAQPAVALAGAPTVVTAILVAPNSGGYQAFALGCEQEADGVFNPMCIRHCSVRDNTEWLTGVATTAREYVLTGGGRIVSGRLCGPNILVWSNEALFIGQFVGSLDQPWRFTRVAGNCGLIGPGAAVIQGDVAWWISPDRQFWRYALGGAPEPVTCPIREQFVENLAEAQGDKIVASANAQFSEVRFDYPDQRDGSAYENSRYLTLCVSGPDAGAWAPGIMARTAFTDAGLAQYPIGVTADGNCYFHEKGHSADGGAFSWFVRSADQYLDENLTMAASGVWPDLLNQQGPVYVEVSARFYPQDSEVTTGPMLMAPGAQKVDFRLSGRLFRVLFSGSSGPTQARLGKIDFDVTPSGQR